jgi:ATP-dependent helicase HepA
MPREEKEANVARFRTDPAAWLLVCDETGGEGRNFQFAEAVIHFDTPWYVSRVEQRIGRLDRLGSARTEIASHVFICRGTPEADLVRCFAEGFGVYTESISGLEFALRELEGGMVSALLGPAPMAVDDYLPVLADQVGEERLRDENEAALDEASFDREAAEKYRRGNRLAEAECGVQEAFTDYLRMVANDASARRHHDEEFPEDIWVLRSDEFRHVQVELPEAPRDGAGRSFWKGTFRRAIAQARLDLQFFTVGQPLFDALINTLTQQPTGRTYAIDIRHPGSSAWMGFEFVFTAVPEPSALGSNLGLVNRAQQLFTFRPLHVFVNLKGEVEQGGQALLEIRQGIDPDAKDSAWVNLTKQKVERLDRLDGWRERVTHAAEVGRVEAQRKFRTLVEPAIEPEAAWLKEQIRQAEYSHSGDSKDLQSLLCAIEQWGVALDGAGLLSVNGNLLGRR